MTKNYEMYRVGEKLTQHEENCTSKEKFNKVITW